MKIINLYVNNITRICENCKNVSSPVEKYKFFGQHFPCIEPLPSGNYISNNYPDYNIIYLCYSHCETCTESSNDPSYQKCIKCKPNYFKIWKTTNCEEKCRSEETENYKFYVKDNNTRECINCRDKTEDTSNNSKYVDKNKYIEKPTMGYYNIIYNQTNTIRKCNERCKTCRNQNECLTCYEFDT